MQQILEKYKSLSIVARATIWFLICSIIQKSFAILTTPVFTRLMTTEQYGQYSIYLSWTQILVMITSFRLDYAVFNKGMSKYENDKDSYTLSMQTTTTIITLIFFMIYIIFKDSINNFTELTTELTLIMFLQVFLMNAISFWTIKQRYNFKYKSVVLVTILITVIDAILGVFLVLNTENKGISRIISYAIVQIIVGSLIYIYNIIKGKKIINFKYAIFAMSFNIPLIPHYISTYVLEQSDKLMIQKLQGIDKAGIYSVVYSIGNAINIVTNSITNAITPWLYRRLKENKIDEIKMKFFYIFILVIAIVSFFILCIPEILKLFASPQYYEAVYVVIPIATSVFFTLVYGVFATIEFYYNRNKFSMIISGIAAIINIILNYIFIPLIGYQVAGYTTMLCYSILALGHVIYTNKITKKEKNKEMFNIKYIVAMILVMFLFVIVSNILYKFLLIRYTFIILLIIAFIINRKKIINIIKIFNKNV